MSQNFNLGLSSHFIKRKYDIEKNDKTLTDFWYEIKSATLIKNLRHDSLHWDLMNILRKS